MLLYDLDIANAIHLLILLAAGGGLFGWEQEAAFLTGKYAEFFAPIGYGLTTVLFFLLIPSILPIFRFPRGGLTIHRIAPSSSGGEGLICLYFIRLPLPSPLNYPFH